MMIRRKSKSILTPFFDYLFSTFCPPPPCL